MKATISYQTMHLPPPFAYAYTIKLDFGETELLVEFELEYLNRETISEDDILNEGYSMDDDFKWSGSLPQVWQETLKPPLLHLELKPETEELPVWIHLDIDQGKQGLIESTDEWDYRLQELIQAIYEKSEFEQPLLVQFIDKSNGKSIFYELRGSFATRTCTINKTAISWEDMQTLLSEVFAMDFEGEWEEKPSSDGLWINPDGLSGYQSVQNMSKNNHEKVAQNIIKLLVSLT